LIRSEWVVLEGKINPTIVSSWPAESLRDFSATGLFKIVTGCTCIIPGQEISVCDRLVVAVAIATTEMQFEFAFSLLT